MDRTDQTAADKVSGFTGAPWSRQAVAKLTELWNGGVSPTLISATLRKGEGAVRAKAAELGLPEHPQTAH